MKNNPIDTLGLAQGNPSAEQLEHRAIIQEMFAASPNRRRFFKTLGIASAVVGAAAATGSSAEAQTAYTDFDILNFALNLEYLEAEFYTVATTGQTISAMGSNVTGAGTAGTTSGGVVVPMTGTLQAVAMEIAMDERTHVAIIQNAMRALGGSPIAKPDINLNALGLGFANVNDFLTLARIFEDIGVTAYGGAAPLLKNSTVIGYAARILAAEAYHAGNIRLQIAEAGINTTPVDGADHVPPPSGRLYFPLDGSALTEVRTPAQVLYLAYGAANAMSGGFFPSGVNGLFNQSASAPATSDTSTGSSNGTITASPNPVTKSANGDGVTTISWNAPAGVTTVEVHVVSPGGTLFGGGGPTGSLTTGAWVSNGLTFFLQDVSNGKALTPENTLGTVTVTVS